jgi:branched-chain amino acid transport system permease protein
MQLAVNIVVLGATYALIALGYVAIYRVSRVLNLAHGEVFMLGAYLLLTTGTIFPFGPLGAVLFTACLSIMLGVLIYLFLMRWTTGQAVFPAILTTIAFGIFLRGIAVMFWSSQHRYPGKVLSMADPAIQVGGGAVISLVGLLIVCVTTAAYAGMFLSCASAGGESACGPADRIPCSPRRAVLTSTSSMRSHGPFRRLPAVSRVPSSRSRTALIPQWP